MSSRRGGRSGASATSNSPPKKPAKKEEAPSTILVCSKACGFNTRYPSKQALQVKGKPVKDKGQYLCPNCDNNGTSSTLKPYP